MSQGKRWNRKLHIQNKQEALKSFMAEQTVFSDDACRFLVETMEQGALCHDAQGRVIMFNEAALGLLGLTRQQLVGQVTLDPYGRALHRDGTPCSIADQPANRVLKNGTPVHNEIIGFFNEHDHSYCWLLTSAFPQYRTNTRQPFRIFTLLSDGTPYKHSLDVLHRFGVNEEWDEARLASVLLEREQAQQERDQAVAALQDANARLTLASHMKSNFVSLASYELRTALASIQTFSETLRNNELSNMEVKEFAIDIHKDAHRLQNLINDMLDLDRLETSQIQLQPYWLDLNALINEAVERMCQHTQIHTFHLQLARALPILWGDREKLMLVLVNLLDNAIKFSPAGGVITVTSALEDLSVHVSISDQGIGIPADELDNVFSAYKHIPPDAHHGEGRGVGLSIVREIVLLHGGKVWVESAPGIGSTFHFTLRTTAE